MLQHALKNRWVVAIAFCLCALPLGEALAQRNNPGENPRSPSDRRGLRQNQPSVAPQAEPPPPGDQWAGLDPQTVEHDWQVDPYDAAFAPPGACDWTLGCSPCRESRFNRSVILGRLWTKLEILGWATKGSDVGPLITSSPVDPLTPVADAGVLGLSTTAILAGGDSVHDEFRPGGRLTIGWNWEQGCPGGFEAYYFGLDGYSERFTAAAVDGEGILARPIVNDATDDPDSVLVAYPGLLDGEIDVALDMHFSGAGILLRHTVCGDCCQRTDFLVGYRHARLSDQLVIRENLLALDPASGFGAGHFVSRTDNFQAINHFHGAEFGLESRLLRGNFVVVGLAKAALGASQKTLSIDGRTLIDDGVALTEFEGGVLALPSNMGRYSQQDFGAMGEIGLSVEWQPWQTVKLTLGYSWLYWSDVLRAPEQIDTRVDRDQLAPTAGGGSQPDVTLRDTSFWAHGLTGGVHIDF